MAQLVNGLGGSAGFGENALAQSDDGSSAVISLTSIFGASGIEFYGAQRTGLYVNNNGTVTFGGAVSQAVSIDGALTDILGGRGPIIAPFWGDVDTRFGPGTPTPGGTSTGSNLVYYDLDPLTATFTVTWDDVGRFSFDGSVRNAFQLRLIRSVDPLSQTDDFDIEFRYETIEWAANSGNAGIAAAGFAPGTGAPAVTLPQSGNNQLMLDLENQSNIGDPGRFLFNIRNGAAVLPGGGNERLSGTTLGNERLSGLGGNDTLVGTAGNDTLDGGTGTDTADYTGITRSIILSPLGTVTKATFGTDTLLGIERVIANPLFANTIDALGSGGPTTRLVADLASGFLLLTGIPALGSANLAVENFSNLRGTANDDIGIGTDAANRFLGTAGNDYYDGRGGADMIAYTALDATVTFRIDGNVVKDGLGTDEIIGIERILGQSGFRNMIDGQVAGPQATRLNVRLDLDQVEVIGGSDGTVAFGVENFVDVRGTRNDDTVIGNDSGNTFFGSLGNDTYDGGGSGFDTVDYSALGGAITFRTPGLIEKGALGTDRIANIETVVAAAGFSNRIDGSDAVSEGFSLLVDLAARFLEVRDIPGIGSYAFTIVNFDSVTGTRNNDEILGDAAANAFVGSLGSDAYDGRGGIDLIDYSGLGGAITFRVPGIIDKGALGEDQISGIERIIGAAGVANRIDGTTGDIGLQGMRFVADLSLNRLVVNGGPGTGSTSFEVVNFAAVTGTRNADSLTGSLAGDQLDGAGGNDTLRGGEGDDSLKGGDGADLLDGGAGIDTVTYEGATAGVVASLAAPAGNTGAAAGDTYRSVENLSGTSLDDILTGNSRSNQLSGLNGKDTLLGGAGNDALLGGAGNDSLLGELGNDSLDGGVDNDVLFGGADKDSIDGGTGNDTLIGGAGADLLTGGDGLDMVRFLSAADGVDTILDFNPVEDGFEISSAGFGGLVPLGVLAAANFAANPTGKATAAVAQFTYSTSGATAGRLYFDADGTGPNAKVQIAVLAGAPVITEADFTVIA